MYLRWKNKAGQLYTVQFDATSREVVDGSMTITTHPVEDGSDVSDHAHEAPDKITVEGYISNKPLPSNPGTYADATDAQVSLTGTKLSYRNVHLNTEKGVPRPEFGEAPPDLLDSIKGVVGKVSPGGLTKLAIGAIGGFFNSFPDHAMIFAAPEDGSWEDRAKRVYELLNTAKQERSRFEVGIKMTTLNDMLIQKLSCTRSKADGSGATFNLDFQRVRIVRSATVDAPHPAESRGQPEKSEGQKPPEADKTNKKRQSIIHKVVH